jgi:uncharacterized protein YeaO (DUF488 family)
MMRGRASARFVEVTKRHDDIISHATVGGPMTTPGTLYDTYVAALRHDLVALPSDVIKFGVVRRPTRWLHPYVDENVAALGPPDPLLDDFQARHEALQKQEFEDAEAHNRAWIDVNYDERYREHLVEPDAAMAALERLKTALRNGTDIALVCYENTESKRCHRTILRKYLV